MRFTKEQYLSAMEGYFGPDEEISNQVVSVVKVRKNHECMGVEKVDDHEIPAGSTAVRETAIQQGVGRVSCYVCLPCADKWVEEIEVV